ncbi:MAG TPA: dihydrofolate reductase family protein [Aestuariivirgaceae bacterium]|jgi:dihydrofolate reductase|nr:dihydrofolate reductase family protein [Aestuariivirgaceae bacterium]
MRKSRQIIAYLGVSIDGRIAGMGHDIDWLLDYDPYEFGFAEFLANVDTLIAGRTTFEIIRHDWAYGDRRCVVITGTPLDKDAPPSCVAVLSPGEAVAEARRLARKNIWVVGGGLTIGGLLDLDAIDRLEIAVVPVIVGSGPALAEGNAVHKGWKLTALKQQSNCILYTYQRDR